MTDNVVRISANLTDLTIEVIVDNAVKATIPLRKAESVAQQIIDCAREARDRLRGKP